LVLVGPTLYGTAEFGDIFKVNTDGTGYSVLHTFTGGSDGSDAKRISHAVGSTLYGTTSSFGTGGGGTIYEINLDGSGYNVLHSFNGADGSGPTNAALAVSGSTLYGMTNFGGSHNLGTVFEINTDGSGFQKPALIRRRDQRRLDAGKECDYRWFHAVWREPITAALPTRASSFR